MSETQHRLALSQGTRIREFEFHRVLGYGGFGITYLGWNLSLDIPVAIKEYLPTGLATREQDGSVVPQTAQAAADFQWGLERFVDEARTLARFQHPNIVGVHQYFEAHSTAYIVMDYVEGEDLSAHLERKGTLQEAELKAILYPLLSALEVVHGADFLHRDIKPGNIVLRDTDGSPVLLDFGAARQAVGAKSRSVTSIVTPGYAPIEQYSSQGHQGPWTDIYALGGVCYRALTGQAPEDATDRMRDDPLVPVAQQCAGRASAAFLSAIDWALSVDEGARPQRVEAWREAMEGATAGQQAHRQDEEKHGTGDEIADAPVTAQAASRVEDAKRLNRWFKLHYICLAAVISLTALTFVGIGVFLESQGSDPDSTFEILVGLLLIMVAIVLFVLLVLTLVFGCLILHKLWSLIPTHKARTTPGKAVGFLFIPFFNSYWLFVAIYGLAKALNAETGRKSVSEVASFIYCCSFWVYLVALLWAIVAGSAPTWIVKIGNIVGFVLWFVVLRQMKNAGRLILQVVEQDGSPLERPKKPRFKRLAAALGVVAVLVGGIMYVGFLIDAQDNEGDTPLHQFSYTPLHHAAAKDASAMAKGLLENGADVNAQDNEGDTPLHIAAGNNASAVAKVLLENGADVNAQDNESDTPLHIAAGKDASAAAEVLLENGAQVNVKNKYGDTPLHSAAGKDASAAAEVLLENGAQVNAQNKYGSTPLHIAAGKDAPAAAEVLLENGAQVNVKNKYGDTPLHIAAGKDASAAAKVLLENGTQVNAQDINGSTPLHIAAEHNASAAAEVLLENGADVNAQDINGSTPLRLATWKNSYTTAEVLRRYGGRE